ncbi:MAG: peptidase s1 pa clan [Verrucomicrobiaceae bacterium]|nr:peptidase s1 pa clan [Verrucomicrobiaceae bacterium]
MKQSPVFLPLVAACCLSPVFAQDKSQETPQDSPPPRTRALASTAQAIDVAAGDSDNIVNIDVSMLFPDYREPWNAGTPSGGSGTGFMIGKNRFLTNAHVVSNATRIVIRTTNDPAPHPARIVHIAHDCDLAIVEAINGADFEKLETFQLGDIPKLNTEVSVIGYPIGGERISVTRGVVSRIDFRPYSHTGVDSHLAIQIDAAINPGNSGGPVLQNGMVVGVAFQGYNGRVAQNVGYMIPTPVIKRFLKDIEDGHYDHYVDLAISDFTIENPAQLKALKLTNDGIGVIVADVEPAGSVGTLLKSSDVLLSVDDSPVYNNGLVRVDGELMDMNEVVERKFAGDTVNIKYQRDGEKKEATVTLKRFAPYLTLGEQYNQRPRYVMHAGLVFQPMDKNLMDAHQIRDGTVNYWFDNFLTQKLYKERPEVVILTNVLPDDVNSYLQRSFPAIVDEINGVKIKALADVQEALKKPGDNPDFIVIKLLEKGRPLVLKRSLAAEAQQRIMKNYNIEEDSYLGNE